MSAKKNNKKKQEEIDNTFDLTDDFKCAELLLDADEDRRAFEMFLAIATSEVEKKKRKQDAIDKLIYILLKNSHSFNLLDEETWGIIEKLTEKGKGYEYAYLMMHFKYYVNGKSEKEDKNAYDYLVKYFDSCKKNKSGVSPVAYLQMGICKEWGIGGGIDDISCEKALENYQKALAGGCVDAYKYIVGIYLFGNKEFHKNLDEAKKVFEEGLKCFKEKHLSYKKKHNKKDKEIYPFFANFVNYCFKGEWGKYSKIMYSKGKKMAQCMIDEGIKGGYFILGQYFLFDFNFTMAKNYYEQAIKNNEAQPYDTLADFYFYEDDYEEAYKLAYKGMAAGNDNCKRSLGQLYEKQGDYFLNSNKEKAKICYLKAWGCYWELYYRTGAFHNYLGKLYLDRKDVMFSDLKDKERKEMEEKMEIILEKGAYQLFPESIKYYLRFIQKKHGIDSTGLHSEEADKLPNDYKKKYLDYLKAGSSCEEYVDLRIEYVFKHGDNNEKAKLFKELFDKLYVPSSEEQFVDILKYYDCEKDKNFMIWFVNAWLSGNFERAKVPSGFDKYLNKVDDYRFIDMDKVFEKSDKPTQKKICKLLVDLPVGIMTFKYLDCVYKYADKKTMKKLSQKIVRDGGLFPGSRKQLLDIVDNYDDGQDNEAYQLWFVRGLVNVYFQENETALNRFMGELIAAIENTKDEDLKKAWGAIYKDYKKMPETFKMYYGPEVLTPLLFSLDTYVPDVIKPLVSAIGKTEDENVEQIIKNFVNEIDKFVDSLDEISSESSDGSSIMN